MPIKRYYGLGTGVEGNWAQNANWSPSVVPIAGDSVWLAPGAGSITSGFAQQSIALADFIAQDGYLGTVGDFDSLDPDYLRIDPNYFEWSGEGLSFVELNNATAINGVVFKTARGTMREPGLYLKQNDIAANEGFGSITIVSGNVGIATLAEEEMEISATIKLLGGTLYLGPGVTMKTACKIEVRGGTLLTRATGTCTLATVSGGTLITELPDSAATYTDIQVLDGGTLIPNAPTNTYTAVTLDGGIIKAKETAQSRTFTAFKYNRGTFERDHNSLTIGSFTTPSGDTRDQRVAI